MQVLSRQRDVSLIEVRIDPRCGSTRGFTLVELMVTLAVAAVLATIAIPSFRTYVLNVRRDSVVDGLVASLHYTRNQALNLNQPTTLCAGNTGASCTGGAWANGWQAVTVPAGAATVILATHVLQASATTPVLTVVPLSTSVAFNGTGLVTNMGALGVEVMKVCDARGAAYARAVEINRAGYIQSSPLPGVAPDGTTALVCP